MTPDELARQAWAAAARQDGDEALRLWQAVRDHAPERLDGHVWPIQILWQRGRFAEAEAMAAAATARFPEDPELAVQQAWIAAAQQRWDTAAEHWAAVRSRAPERIEGYLYGTHALWRGGRLDAAETLAAEGLARFPGDADLLAERAWIATAREAWTDALDRWNEVIKARPGHAVARERIDQALRILGRVGGATSAAPDDEESTPAKLMLRFESIGERCDFGAVQRHFGAEPLGLLRFAGSKLDGLVAALDDRFAAVGTVEDTGFERYGDETIVRIHKYGLIFHTFVYGVHDQTAEEREAFHGQQRRRLVFLKDKLIRDLEDPQKILVYATDEYAADAEAVRLFAALRAYGPNTLLYVRPERAGRPAGTVERLDDGLFAGYFPGLTDFVHGINPPYELWQQLCLRVLQAAGGP